MELRIEKREFLAGLHRCQSIVERRTSMPILGNVLLDARKKTLFLSATDLEVSLQQQLKADILQEGKTTLPARHLFEIVRELPNTTIHIKGEENHRTGIRCEKSVFYMNGLLSEDFPSFPEIKGKKFYKIQPDAIREMIEKTIFSVSTDETRYHLNGVFFEKVMCDNKETLRMVATDGHRLSVIDKPFDFSGEVSFGRGIIIPKKGLFELKKLLEEEGAFEIAFDDNNIILRKEGVLLIMRLIDGDYPDYQQVIPKENKRKAIIKKDPFIQALRRMSLLSDEKTRTVRLSLQSGSLCISTHNPLLGEAKEEFSVDYDGDQLEIGFNAKYFLDILNVINSDEISLELNDKLSPGVVKVNDDSNYTCVVMPMRI